VHPTGDVDHKGLRADGVDYLAVREDAPEANVAAALDADLRVFVYGVDRRHQHDRLAGLGVHGFITDDPVYVSRRLAPLPTDAYVAQTFWHGCLPSREGDRGRFTPPDWWGYADAAPGDVAPASDYRGALQ